MFRQILIALCVTMVAEPVTGQGRPAAVGVETVEARALAETVPVFAEVVTSLEGEVATRVSGSVSAVTAIEGAFVTAGDPLVALDTELLSILLRRAEAEVAVANAGLNVAQARAVSARTTLERITRLQGSSSSAGGRFDDAQRQLLEAEIQIPEAEARLAVAEVAREEAAYNLARATVVAPFDGVVLDVRVSPGEFIQTGAPVVRMLDISTLEIEASVPARYAEQMVPGLTVQARTETGTDFEATVRALLPIETAATRTRPVRFSAMALVGARTTALGQSVTVLIPVGAPRDVLTVPKDALVQARGGWTVFAVQEGVAQPRTVEVGIAVGDRFEVLSGLSAGDVVVVRGNERLRPGQAVAAPGGAPGGGPGAGPEAAPGGQGGGAPAAGTKGPPKGADAPDKDAEAPAEETN